MGGDRYRVGIVGCGSAGPALSALLARQGHEVTLFERAPELLPVGTGFVIQPTGLWVLDRIGIREEVISHGGVIDGLRIDRFVRPGRRRPMVSLEYDMIRDGLFGVGMYRPTILEYLVRAMKDAGAELRTGIEVTGVGLRGGKRIFDTDQGEQGPFDLVVFSNGARSLAREWLALPHRALEHRWGAFWAIVPDEHGRFGGHLHQVVRGTEKMLGVLPTGVPPGGERSDRLVSLFWSVRADRRDAERARGVDAINDEILEFNPRLDAALSHLKTIDDWMYSGYWDITMKAWHKDRAVVIGDAAHSMTPQLGNGVNLALCDAWTLAYALEVEPDIDAALAHYTRARKHHLHYYSTATRWITHLFQSSVPGLASLRRAGFGVAAHVPPIREQMVRSMAGIKRGLLRRSYPSDGSPGRFAD
jgi:2-polyprenyl-6-methoxyphenol hydroxylase-like FAD-dependent oxidoreductase